MSPVGNGDSFVVVSGHDQRGGIARSNLRTWRALAARIGPTVCLWNGAGRRVDEGEISVEYRPRRPGPASLLWAARTALAARRHARCAARTSTSPVLVACDPWSWIVGLWCRRSFARFLVEVHTDLASDPPRSAFAPLKWSALKWLALRASRRADSVRAVTGPTLDLLSARGCRALLIPPRLQPMWTETPASPKVRSNGVTTVLAVGSLIPRKGFDRLIRAAAMLVHESPGRLELRIAGDGPCRDQLERLVDELDAAETVTLLGNLDEERLRREYEHADLFVSASHQEGLARVVLEAIASCTPVLATRVGGLEQVLTELQTPRFVDGDVDGLADGISERLTAPVSPAALERDRDIVVSEYGFSHNIDRLSAWLRGDCDDSAAAEHLPAVCYVIPEYSPRTTQHFAHVPRLLHEIAGRLRLRVIVERGEAPAELSGEAPIDVVPSGSRVRRSIALAAALARARRAGTSTFFLRYSRVATLMLLLTRPFSHHHVLLWASGQANHIEVSEQSTLLTVRHRVDDHVKRWIFRRVDLLVTGPERMIDYMTQRWSLDHTRVGLLYNDIDTDHFVPLDEDARRAARSRFGWRDHDFVVLCVHRLSPRRGTRLLPQIIGGLAPELRRRVRLVIVGDGPDREALARWAESTSDAVEVLGPVPNRALPAFYGGADCFVMPSYEEGFPRVVLEAMASALPIVATRAGGTADILAPDYEYLCEVGDVGTMTAMLASLMRAEREVRVQVGARLRVRAMQRYASPRVAEMFLELVEQPR